MSAHWRVPIALSVLEKHGCTLPPMFALRCSLPAHDVRRLFAASACLTVLFAASSWNIDCSLPVLMPFTAGLVPHASHCWVDLFTSVHCHFCPYSCALPAYGRLLCAASFVFMETGTAVLAVHCQRLLMPFTVHVQGIVGASKKQLV